MGNLDVSFFNQIINIAKALGEHAILLNLDDMQMGRLGPKLIGDITIIPIARDYPMQLTPKIKEEMEALGITDFWDYFFYEETKIKMRKQNEEKKKPKKSIGYQMRFSTICSDKN